MIRLFLLLSAATLALLPADARADLGQHGWCKADRTPQIEVKTSTDQVTWDFSKSQKDLDRFSIDTDNPYGANMITHVGGLMSGGIELRETMSYRTITHNRMNQICYWFDKVVVTLHINPTIYIASEFPQGSCKHNAIKEHELKHIEVDREIVNKYAGMIGQALRDDMAKQSLFGPYMLAQTKDVEKYLKERVEYVLRYYSDMMQDERKRRQQLVDSLHEYERVNKLCN